ncbi:DASH family cryptochrome [Robiginitalea sp. IMCC43444]|uniref:DASH family cryptochrome n=1 Tax=Robiginitalea sp. IMCC43444 TaxID=3459121 RepID=UPI004040F790
MKTALYWFRNDLRILDNAGLSQAGSADHCLAVYCFDPRHFSKTDFGFPKTGKFRAKFLLETVAELKDALKELNISLLVHRGKPEEVIPEICREQQVNHIFSQAEWTTEEVAVYKAVEAAVPAGIEMTTSFEQFLFHPDDIPYTSYSTIPEVFTQFRKACEKQASVRTLAQPLAPKSAENLIDSDTGLPSPEQLGFEPFEPDPRSAFPFRGGEKAAKERLNHYFWESKKLSFYKKTRNGLLGTDYSSKFSPWLANGSLSARTIYWEVKKYEREIKKNQDTYWLIFELIWRDYFKYISLKHGPKIFFVGGIKNRDYPWGQADELLQRWTQGRTDCDFVNANMLELAHTGWMSNRGRQNVASYWAKEWEQDWRIGASYFESLLLDYDVHSNWGNWMYNSGVGNDPRDRKFNTSLQADRYDPSGKFRRTWLQETLF